MLGALLLNNIGLPRGPTYDKIGLVLLVHNVALWGRSAVLESEEREELALQRRENRALTEEVRTAFDSFMEIIGEFKKWMEGEITALFDLFRKKDRNARDRLRRREAVQEESPQMELIDGDPNANG